MTDSGNDISWDNFQTQCLRYPDLGISLDFSRIRLESGFLESMKGPCEAALKGIAELEGGAIANPDEERMVGHYWLRAPELAPTPDLEQKIKSDQSAVAEFAAAVHSGTIASPSGKPFQYLLVVGIGGSALGPQLVADAIAPNPPRLQTWFFDNTDPDGMEIVIGEIGDRLKDTLVLVVSKSGTTPETRNGMLTAQAAFKAQGLDFSKHAAAITGPGSVLDNVAVEENWLQRFAMDDWVGGRTSVMSVVGLVPAALQGVDVEGFLAGAAAMDAHTRATPAEENMSLLLALMWHAVGKGRGEKDMVILPYKDRLLLFSKYLQQLVMESLGKELDREGKTVHQGIAVYGNKGSTDQHAYVQQLRDGLDNFFATFIEVRKAQSGDPLDVGDGASPGDFLQGFFRGTRSALFESGRDSLTISIPELDARTLGALIALYERAVSFYAELVNINAYHQPGVQAGKKAASRYLELTASVRQQLSKTSGPVGASALAKELSVDPEDVFHVLNHLAANDQQVTCVQGALPDDDRFSFSPQ